MDRLQKRKWTRLTRLSGAIYNYFSSVAPEPTKHEYDRQMGNGFVTPSAVDDVFYVGVDLD